MEEARPGQTPEADRKANERDQNRAARPGGKARDGLSPTEQDLRLVADADARAASDREKLRAGGFGDHKGVEGFPAPTAD